MMDFHYTVTTNKSITEAIETLEQQLQENKFGILWQLDIPAKLKEKGVESYQNPYHVLEVCSPSVAAKVLNIDETVGYFLPCKIVVYAHDGSSKIGLTKPTALLNMIDNEEILNIAQDVESTLINVLDQSK